MAFDEWLATHPTASGTQNHVVNVTFTQQGAASSAPWAGGPVAEAFEVIGWDDFGIILRRTSDQSANSMFIPWPSIRMIE